jgi:hypothetical protein
MHAVMLVTKNIDQRQFAYDFYTSAVIFSSHHNDVIPASIKSDISGPRKQCFLTKGKFQQSVIKYCIPIENTQANVTLFIISISGTISHRFC